MKSPDNVGRVFNVARLLETLKRNLLVIIDAVKRADDNEGGVGLALKSFELMNNVVDTCFVGGKFDVR